VGRYLGSSARISPIRPSTTSAGVAPDSTQRRWRS
jgi:hypothetical protein